jgi:signal peptidase I
MAMNSEELQPVGWLSEVVLEGSDQPVRVVLDGREGNRVFVRQADPEDGDDPPRVPLFPGDELIVMQALTHVSHHITPDVGRTDDLLFSTRIVPVRREPGRVFARTLRRNEPDQGTRVHVRPGDEVTFEVGAVVAELDAIDDSEQEATIGYAPLTPVLWTWLQLGTGRSEATVRYLLVS